MPTKQPEEFEYLSNNPDYVPDPDIEEFMEQEISRAPKDPELLVHRLRSKLDKDKAMIHTIRGVGYVLRPA